MCGRLNVTDAPIANFLMNYVGMPFKAETNLDLRPTQTVEKLYSPGSLQKKSAAWEQSPRGQKD